MSDDEPRAVVLHLFGPPPTVDGVPTVAERIGFCHPHAPLVDRVSRAVTCRRCKHALDPVDVLLEVARKYDEWVRLGKETSTARRRASRCTARRGTAFARAACRRATSPRSHCSSM